MRRIGFLLVAVWLTVFATTEPPALAKPLLIAQATPAAPTFSPAYGFYTNSTFVASFSFSISAPSGTIYFTTDGTTPTTSSPVYSGAVSFSNNTQVNAIAVVSGVSSPVASAWYAADPDAYLFPTSNFLLWLRADFGPITSSGNISTWGDVSLSENNASGVSPTQPTLLANSVNDLPAARFVPGTNGQFLSIPSSVSNFSSGFSAFVIAAPSSTSSGAQLLSLGSGSLANSISFSENSSAQPTLSVYNSSGTSTSVSSSAAFPTNQFQLYEAIQSGTTATLYTNGIQTAQGTTMNTLPTGASTANYLGQSTAGGSYFSGQIAETIIYSTALTQSQRSVIEAYLMQKYQIGLPTTAPAISTASGTLTAPTQVVLSAPANENIFYSIDGSTPSASSTPYTGPINVLYSQTIKAIATNGSLVSPVSTATYLLDSTLYPAPSPGGVPLQINLTLPSTAIP